MEVVEGLMLQNLRRATRILKLFMLLSKSKDYILSWRQFSRTGIMDRKLLPAMVGLIILLGIINNSVLAQIQPFPSAIPGGSPGKIGVKITSPLTGQKIAVGQPISIYGTSTDNAKENCQVSIIMNNLKPYQKSEATGKGGNNDYSSWIFKAMSEAIKMGQNKITAKLDCLNSPTNLTKWYSVNLTGTS